MILASVLFMVLPQPYDINHNANKDRWCSFCDQYFKLDTDRVTRLPREAFAASNFRDFTLSIFVFDSIGEAQDFEQFCLDTYVCSLNTERKVKKTTRDTGYVPVWVYDRENHTLQEFVGMTIAQRALSIPRKTIGLALKDGLEVKGRYTFFSEHPGITFVVNRNLNPHSGEPVFVYKDGLLVGGVPFTSKRQAALALGLKEKTDLRKVIDTGTSYKGYEFYSKSHTGEDGIRFEIKHPNYIPAEFKLTKIWVYSGDKLVKGSPFHSKAMAARVTGVGSPTISKHLDKGTMPGDSDLIFYTKPKM